MNSRERILAAWSGEPQDHPPLTTWCFGFSPDPALRWTLEGVERQYWYSLRLEHIHTLPQPWSLEDDFRRVLAWRSLGVDDVLDVSVPWGIDSRVTWEDGMVPAGIEAPDPVAARLYHTPGGDLRHAVRLTGEGAGPGWVVQPETVPLFEDFNIPRATHPLVATPDQAALAHYLYTLPDEAGRDWFAGRMREVRAFAGREGIAVQAWSAFGMDAAVWMTGVENAVLMAIDEPNSFGRLVDQVFAADYGRTELAASTPGVDMVIQRGWYSSTDFWSPKLFEQFTFPHLAELADLAHRRGVKFGYVMTTGVKRLGPRLADAGVDVLYFADPIQDRLSLEWAREVLAPRMTLVGGTNALSLASGDPKRIRAEVRRAVEALGPTNRFILHPVDALFPDTPWEGVEALIEAWRRMADAR